MSFTLCTSGAIILKSGLNANATAIASSAILGAFCDEAESEICALTRYDWVANIGSVNTNFKPILAAATSALAALKVIGYDPSGYTSRFEAQFMADILTDDYTRNLKALKEANIKEVMK